jgi:hypothetical protein
VTQQYKILTNAFHRREGHFCYLWRMSGGLAAGANITFNYNKGLRKANRIRYSKVKEQYVGVGNETGTPRISNLTPAQLVEGRKRAKAYYTKRNLRIYTQIIVISVLACTLVGWLVWYLLG